MTNETSLRDWIGAHRVCFEVSPHYELYHHDRLQVGFELALFARPSKSASADPGGPEAGCLFERLKEIAAAVMPSGTEYAILPFDTSFHLRTASSWQPEVQLVVEILHGATFSPVDEQERRYAREVRQALLRLGAQEGTWSEIAAAARRTEVLVR
jgi:hypothetical protein